MNADSSGPSRARDDTDPSNLAYCRRLPYRSCSALTAGVNTNDPKFGDISSHFGPGPAQRRPGSHSESMPPLIAASRKTTQYDWRFLLRASPVQSDRIVVALGMQEQKR